MLQEGCKREVSGFFWGFFCFYCNLSHYNLKLLCSWLDLNAIFKFKVLYNYQVKKIWMVF